MFSDSCVKKVFPFRTIESNTAIPDKIFPVYIGSGKMVMSLDSLGLQSLNNRIQYAYGCFPNAGDMYIVKQGMVGDVLSPHNTLPLGRLGYELEIDGEALNADTLCKESAMFRRENDILRAQVKTTFIVRSIVCVEITSFIPFGTQSPVFKIRFKNYANCERNPKDVHNVKMRVVFNLKTWQDKSIYSSAVFKNGSVYLTADGHEKYEEQCFFSSNKPLKTTFNGESLSAEFETSAGAEWSNEHIVMLSFDNLTAEKAAELEKEHLSIWRDYYNTTAYVETDNSIMDFMYCNSLYILKLGYEPERGYPIGHPFAFPSCWEACMFWDAHFSMDALMRSGNRENAAKFLKLLKNVMRKEGKPFPWMFIYDGTTFLDDAHDIAPLVISAQAMIAIRYYEYFCDDKVLKDSVYPILLRCAEYAKQNMFSKRNDGKWEVSLAVSNDVVDEEGTEINQTYTALWFAVIFRKTAEYAKILNYPVDATFAEIADNIYLEQNEDEYLHCRGYKASEFQWASWIPFLYYPTEGMPFLDKKKVLNTIEKYTFVELYRDKQNCYQPWTECIEAQSHHRAGLNDEAYKLLESAIGHTFGNGYFSEVGPHQQTVNLPPYLSPHATFVSTYLDTFASSSIWDNEASLFINIPNKLLQDKIKIGGIYSAGKFYVENAEYSPEQLFAMVRGRNGMKLKVRLPENMSKEDIRVFVNDMPFEALINYRKRFAEIELFGDALIKIEIR